ncbi:putative RNA-directed DNA polymerase [Tanacetum coccineum]
MGNDKAPGPDGFTAVFFKKSWDIVGGKITNVVRDFFTNGNILKELNHIIISLIPKVSTPAKINDYHPISCCNVLFKCISKIITNRIKEDLGDLVSINQSAFVPGRRISDNILLTQELMRNYHRNRGPPRRAFKVDIQKAYDTVDWGFLRSILVGFGFHPTMVDWIMVCVSTTSYSVCINGDLYGWFNGKHRLRQDDLFLFTRGLPNSVRVIIDALEEFKNVSGLVPSIPKSTTFFCNVSNALKAIILSSMPFAKGTLPVKYLGVPLISSSYCIVIVRSVLSSMHIYWVLVYILPVRIIHDLEQLMRGFLWCQGEMKKGKAKVALEAVCLPHREGGLGICRLEDFNVALMATYINNGRSTSMWFDKWADFCPLRDMLTVRNIVRSGFSLLDTVSDLIDNGSWKWPHDWLSRFLNIVNIPVPDINNEDDAIVWHDVRGVFQHFSVAGSWDSLRLRADVVDCYHVVWFPYCIPRHAIHMWLVIMEKPKTQDRLRQWDVGPSIDLNLLRCPLCDMVPDSHSHLFFESLFASLVWFQVRAYIGMDSMPPRLVDVLAFLIPSKGSSVSNVISWIVLAAMTYCVWNERNSRLFKKKKSTADQLVQTITNFV